MKNPTNFFKIFNVFWIDCGGGKHKKKFLEVERGRERQKHRQESE